MSVRAYGAALFLNAFYYAASLLSSVDVLPLLFA